MRGCSDLSLCRPAERINPAQRFLNQMKQPLFKLYIYYRTRHESSKKKDLIPSCCLCVSLWLSAYPTSIYKLTLFSLMPNVKPSLKAGVVECASCCCLVFHLWLSRKSCFAREIEVLADRSVKYNQRCLSWN